MNVYRAPMRGAVERALSCGVVGIGEATDERAERRLERFVTAPKGSYVWTRDAGGDAYVGRITGSWRYEQAGAEVDLVNVRDADWITEPVDPALVPAAVAQTFARGGRNFQQIHPGNVEAETAELWDRLSQ
jgi:hypothetical protein